MDVAAFTQALIAYAEQIDDVTPLETERDLLYAAIIGGKDGKTLVSSSVAGKSFGWQVNGLTLQDKFQAFVNAINAFTSAAGTSRVTFPDFSGM